MADLPVISTAELASHVGQKVTLRGWLYNKRGSGKLHFLELRDGAGIVQCVMAKADVGDEAFAAADKVTQESSIEITGDVKAHPKR
ncbi:MAG TPA: OB-fold nucleic acid binding domain-containing protein, partial [Minicystis sp.]|nr:OB-fold nucleic acid binding domain-containing protein [Minicystis sp.]